MGSFIRELSSAEISWWWGQGRGFEVVEADKNHEGGKERAGGAAVRRPLGGRALGSSLHGWDLLSEPRYDSR